MNIYVVQHIHELADAPEDVKLLGVYSSREQAEQAIERLQTQVGFRDALSGFHIDEYMLDQDHWTEGYISEYKYDKSELQINDLFSNVTADILSIARFDEIVQLLLKSAPGEWHVIEKFIQDSPEIKFRLAELQHAIAESGTDTPVPLYCQWTIHPSSANYAIVLFHLEGTLLFQNAIHNISRFS